MHAVEDTDAIDVDEVAPLRRILILELGERRDARIVHEAVDRSIFGLSLGDGGGHRFAVAHIGSGADGRGESEIAQGRDPASGQQQRIS